MASLQSFRAFRISVLSGSSFHQFDVFKLPALVITGLACRAKPEIWKPAFARGSRLGHGYDFPRRCLQDPNRQRAREPRHPQAHVSKSRPRISAEGKRARVPSAEPVKPRPGTTTTSSSSYPHQCLHPIPLMDGCRSWPQRRNAARGGAAWGKAGVACLRPGSF